MNKTNKQKEGKRPGLLGNTPRAKLVATQLEAFLGFPNSMPPAERFKALAIRFQTTPKNLQQTARRYKWRERLEAVAKAQKEQEAFEQTLIDAAPQRLDIPNSVIARSLKDLSFTLLSSLQRLVRSATVLIDYYSGQIAALIAAKGGVGYLTDEDLAQLHTWQQQLTGQAKLIDVYLKPSGIAALLDQVNFRYNLPANLEDTDDPAAFTPARLQATLLALGLPTAFQLARGEVPAVAGASFAPYSGLSEELPEIGLWAQETPTA